MDHRWRELQREAQYDPRALDQFTFVAARNGVFSDGYLTYLSSIRMPLGLSRIGKRRGRMEQLIRDWKRLIKLNKYLAYQRLITVYQVYLDELLSDPAYDEFNPQTKLIADTFNLLSTYGPHNPPSYDDDELDLLLEKLVLQREYLFEFPDYKNLNPEYQANVLMEITCDAVHFVNAFLAYGDEDGTCGYCGVEFDWDQILRYIPLLTTLDPYLMKKYLGDQDSVPKVASSIKQRILKQKAYIIARKKTRRNRHPVLRDFLVRAEKRLWLKNLHNMHPGIVWN